MVSHCAISCQVVLKRRGGRGKMLPPRVLGLLVILLAVQGELLFKLSLLFSRFSSRSVAARDFTHGSNARNFARLRSTAHNERIQGRVTYITMCVDNPKFKRKVSMIFDDLLVC